MHLIDVHLLGIHIRDGHLRGGHVKGVHLIGMHLIGVYLIGAGEEPARSMVGVTPSKVWGRTPFLRDRCEAVIDAQGRIQSIERIP